MGVSGSKVVKKTFLQQLKEYYASLDELPKLIDDEDIKAQSIKEFYVTLQMIMQGKASSSKEIKEERRERPAAAGAGARGDEDERPAAGGAGAGAGAIAPKELEARPERDGELEALTKENELVSYDRAKGAKKSVSVEGLLDAEDPKDVAPSKILILGRAGVGKTTLMHYVSYKWGDGELWQDKFDYVFRVRLRDLTSSWESSYDRFKYNGKELICFIHYCLCQYSALEVSPEELTEALSKDKTLLLIDGYDEIAHLAEKPGTLAYKIMKQITAQKNIIMTSRPNAISSTLESAFERKIENIGLDSTGIKSYIRAQFKSEEAEGSKLIEFLGATPALNETCETPVNLAMVSLIWKDPTSRSRFASGISASGLYKEMLMWLAKRYLNKFRGEAITNVTESQLYELPEFKVLKELAFEGFRTHRLALELDSGLIERVIRKHEVRIEDVHKFGLLRAETSDKKVIDKRHEFIHLTFQEYLVALQVVEALKGSDKTRGREAAEFVATYKYNSRFLMTMKFIAGLIGDDKDLEEIFWEILLCHKDGEIEFGDEQLIKLVLQLFPQMPAKEGAVIENREKVLKLVEAKIRTQFEVYAPYFIAGEYPASILPIAISKVAIEPIEALKEEEIVLAIRALGRIGSNQAIRVIELLIPLLAVKNEQIFIAVAEVLGKVRHGEAERIIELLKQFLASEKPQAIKLAALRAICSLSSNASASLYANIKKIIQEHVGMISEVGEKHYEKMIPILLPLLKDEDYWVRHSAAKTLGKIGEKHAEVLIPAILPLLKSADFNLRSSTAQALGKIGEKHADVVVPALLPLLKDKRDEVRSSAAEALGTIGEKHAEVLIPAILPLLKDKDSDVRSNAAKVLGEIGGKHAEIIVPALLPLLKDKEWFVKSSVAETLGKIGGKHAATIVPAISLLIKAHISLLIKDNDEDKYVIISAAEALGEIGDKHALTIVPAVSRFIKDEDKYIREDAVKALGKIGEKQPETIVPAVLPFLEDKKPQVAKSAVKALGKIGEKHVMVVPALLKLLEDKDKRNRALFALGNIGEKHADAIVPKLLPLLKDEDKGFRGSTAEALGKLGEGHADAVVPAILSFLEEYDKFDPLYKLNYVPEVLEALGKIGKKHAEKIIPVLLAIHKDNSSNYVKDPAAKALEAILGKGPDILITSMCGLINEADNEVRKITLKSFIKRIESSKVSSADLDVINTTFFTSVNPEKSIVVNLLLKKVLANLMSNEHEIDFIANTIVHFDVPITISRQYKIIYNSIEYEIPGTLSEKQAFINNLFSRIEAIAAEKSLPNPLDRYTAYTPVYTNRTKVLQIAASDVVAVPSIVNRGALLKYGAWHVHFIEEPTDGKSIKYIIVEGRNIFGEVVIYKLQEDLSITLGFPKTLHPEEITLAYREMIFNINPGAIKEFHIKSVAIPSAQKAKLLDCIIEFAIPAEARVLREDELLGIELTTEKRERLEIKVVLAEHGKEIKGLDTRVEAIEVAIERFAADVVRREEISEALLSNEEDKLKRVEVAYIEDDFRLNQFYQTFGSSLYETLIAASAIHSGLVDNCKAGKYTGYVEQVASSASSIIDYLAAEIPGASYVTKAIAAVVNKAITITQDNAVKRLLQLAPERFAMAEVVERASRLVTLALEDKIKETKEAPRAGAGAVIAAVSKWGKKTVGIFEDLDTIYKREAALHAAFIIKKAMNGELKADIFISDEVLLQFAADIDLRAFQASRIRRAEEEGRKPKVTRKREEINLGVEADMFPEEVVILATSSAAGAGAGAAGGAGASSSPMVITQSLEEVIKGSRFNYQFAITAIETIADTVRGGRQNHKLRAHRTWWEAKTSSTISIKRELLGYLADTPPNEVDGAAVYNVLNKYNLLQNLTFVRRELSLEELTSAAAGAGAGAGAGKGV